MNANFFDEQDVFKASDFDVPSDDIDPRDSYNDRFKVVSRDSSQRRYIKPAINSDSHQSSIYNYKKSSLYRDSSNNRIRVNSSLANEDNNQNTKKEDSRCNATINPSDLTKKNQYSDNVDDGSLSGRSTRNFSNQSRTNTRHKSSGLDSLFESTSESYKKKDDNDTKNYSSVSCSVKKDDAAQASRVKFDYSKIDDVNTLKKEYSYEDSLQNARNKINGSRGDNLVILKPVDFNQVEDFSRAIKNNAKIVLSLKDVTSLIAQNIFNFALGASSVSNYKVSLVGDKTYFFSRGLTLSKDDRLDCFKQGLILKDNL